MEFHRRASVCPGEERKRGEAGGEAGGEEGGAHHAAGHQGQRCLPMHPGRSLARGYGRVILLLAIHALVNTGTGYEVVVALSGLAAE